MNFNVAPSVSYLSSKEISQGQEADLAIELTRDLRA
jgi:hypothetical protein